MTTTNELALVRTMAHRFDAIVAGVYVRASSGSGRLDLSHRSCGCCRISRVRARDGSAVCDGVFWQPVCAAEGAGAPAMLATYDFSDSAELSAVRAIAGEIPISGKLPITLPGLFPVGHGLVRPVAATQ